MPDAWIAVRVFVGLWAVMIVMAGFRWWVLRAQLYLLRNRGGFRRFQGTHTPWPWYVANRLRWVYLPISKFDGFFSVSIPPGMRLRDEELYNWHCATSSLLAAYLAAFQQMISNTVAAMAVLTAITAVLIGVVVMVNYMILG